MTSISKQASTVDVINLFEARNAEGQDDILLHLHNVTVEVMQGLPGFISANLHRSIPSPLAPPDKFYVANYAQWEQPANLAVMMRDPRAIAHMDEIVARYPRTGALFRLASIYPSDSAASTVLSPDGVAVINVFETANEQGQEDALQHLHDITIEVMEQLPGFVSANLHRSIPSPLAPPDKFYVVNYAQWEQPANLAVMMRDPRAIAHMDEIVARYPRTGALFRLVSTFGQTTH